MNILVVGSGAREHAIAKALNRSLKKPAVFCFGTSLNPGIEDIAHAYYVGDINNVSDVQQKAEQWSIDLAIIGPEAPLEQGLADALWNSGIKVIGPKQALAQIETSKSFARNLMKKYDISGLPKYRNFTDINGIETFLHELGLGNFVVKANGLMAGKGVKVAGEHLHSFSEAMDFCREIFSQNQTLVIEEKLIGQEFSFMCFSDGNNLVPMPVIQDNKRAFENDTGPNTGGMGSYSMADHRLPFLTQDDINQALHINQEVINGLMTETKEKYIGILYGGFIATANGVYVIEFNARFGDPESLNVLSILQSDFVDLCVSMVNGNLQKEKVEFANLSTVCKYAVPNGYPDKPLRDVEIDITQVENMQNLYLAAVNAKKNKLYATGSRAVAYVGIADNSSQAEQIAESQIKRIKGPLFHRGDIGTEKMISNRVEFMRKLRAR
ncbi:phosphoribosylamine--glycine ligase [Legionella waltersii]|uniref:Phosphoribosylamine--glycine ligase n=1 Tax=Legionella waltersii TaxID=66969 RepID=A0A0W1A1F1_9GAMM|nr:phosphoribosylamine--glycine ligase [Legionella waltersii]KTD75156.1 phosphoribosylamine-glycine ligase [Legionella waltersii]SNV04772.1 phosphoribosylamine--glycine ligase [Legionella waltersii]